MSAPVKVKLISAEHREYLTKNGNFLVTDNILKKLVVKGIVDDEHTMNLRTNLTIEEVATARDMGLIVPVILDPEYEPPIISSEEW